MSNTERELEYERIRKAVEEERERCQVHQVLRKRPDGFMETLEIVDTMRCGKGIAVIVR